VIAALEQARGDSRVRAIVLRVNSPGGSALASDLISREIARTRKLKPVICSLGDIAASGGYYVAAECDAIFAEPSTITGSIGLFTGKFDVSGLAARLGVGIEISRRGAHPDMESWFRPYTDEERALILDGLRYYYGRFVGVVAEGRGMKPEAVEAVARGRVWTGAAAKERKLVDHLGGFVDALMEAKRRGGLDPWEDAELVALPSEPGTLLGQLLQLLGINLKSESTVALDQLLAPLAPLLRMIPPSLLVAPSTPQARLPFTQLW
jgi:protease-4